MTRDDPPVASRRAGVLRTVGLDLVGPLAVYQVARSTGIPEVWALVLSGLLPGLGVLTGWLRWRRLDVVGVVVLGGIALSLALAVATDDPSIVLLESAVVTAAFGVACLLSLGRRRPLIFHFAQTFYGGPDTPEGAELDDDADTYPEARAYWRTVTATWGVVYLIEAVAKALVVQLVPVGTALALNRTVPWLVFAALLGWSVWWGNRLRALKESDEAG